MLKRVLLGLAALLAFAGPALALTPAQRAVVLTPQHWTPAQLGSALVMWLDASQPNTITLATGVSNWASRNGGIAATQPTGTAQPTYTTGKSVNFTAGAYTMSASGAPSVYDVIVVGNPTAPSTSYRIPLWAAAAQEFMLNINTSNFGYYSSGFVQFGSYTWTGQAVAYVSVPASKVPSGAINGGAISAGTTALTSTAIAAIGNGGSGSTGNQFGSLSEVLIVNRKLTSDEYNKVIGYEACKWGLQSSLPASHPYRYRCP